MIIAVNTRLLIKDRLEGIGRFAYETLKRITQAHPEHHFFFLFDRQWDDSFIFSKNITPLIISPQARHPLLYLVWFDLMVPRVLKRIKADLFLSPDGFLSRFTSVPSLPVFHDLNFVHHPMDVPWHDRLFYHTYFPVYARKAARIVSVSAFSRQDIHETYHVPLDNIDIVYNGVSDHFYPTGKQEAEAYRKHLTNGKPYFLFIGAQHPRKNLSNLFKAFDILRSSGNEAALVIAGAKKWWNDDIRNAFNSMKYKDDVVFTGRLDNESLNLTLGAAKALAYVSYFEGFGIPILEAFRCQVPVITSNLTALPEVAGDAALLTDPRDPSAIAHAMLQLLLDEDLNKTLINKGKTRLASFSWDRTASLLWESICKTANPDTMKG